MPNGLEDLLRDPMVKDMTKNGQCSRCGGCCSALLPLTKSEQHIIKRAVETQNIKPSMPPAGISVTVDCPFLQKPNLLTPYASCKIYNIRPAICRSFLCSHDRVQNMKAYMNVTDEIPSREPVNMWSFFGLTGIRYGDKDIPSENGPQVTVWDDKGDCYTFCVGKFLTLKMLNGKTLEGLVLAIEQEYLLIMDKNLKKTIRAKYKQIDQVLSESAKTPGLTPPEDANKI